MLRRCVVFGGSGEVGGAVLDALVREEGLVDHVTVVTRRPLERFADSPRVEQHVVDMSGDGLEQKIAELSAGHDVAVSCLGIGAGSWQRPAEEIEAIEVGLTRKVVQGVRKGGVEHFLQLTACIEFSEDSWIREYRFGAAKERLVEEGGFTSTAIFKPGMILGNKHTPAWAVPIANLFPATWNYGGIPQTTIADAFVGHLKNGPPTGQSKYFNEQLFKLAEDARA